MEWGTPVQWGKFLLFCVPQSVKTKETNPTRLGSPTPCKQALRFGPYASVNSSCRFQVTGMISGFFWIGKFWQVIFGQFDLSRDFWGYSKLMFLFFMLYHLMLSRNFYGSEFRHKIFWGLNFGPGTFLVLFEAQGLYFGF